jgi:hypothetical protein
MSKAVLFTQHSGLSTQHSPRLVQLVTNEYPNSIGSAGRIFGGIMTMLALIWIVNLDELYLAISGTWIEDIA